MSTPDPDGAGAPSPGKQSPGTPARGAPEVRAHAPPSRPVPALPPEFGGPSGPEPTRYGDWEHKGRCSDF